MVIMIIIGFMFVILVVFMVWMHAVRMVDKEADALIILGYKCDGDKIPVLLKERLDTAMNLLNRYPFQAIILSGGAVISTKSEAEVMLEYLLKQGVPKSKIILDQKSFNTVDNIFHCKSILNENKLKTCVIVSNSFHIRRIGYISKKLCFPATFYASRNFNSIVKQFHHTINEIVAFRLTLPLLKEIMEL